MKCFTTILITLLCIVSYVKSINAQHQPNPKNDRDCGMICGDYHSFFVCAPKGWVLDDRSGVSQGLHAVFYPSGMTWQNSPAVMYVNWAAKDKVIKDIKSLVQFNIDRFKANGSLNIKAEFQKKIKSEKEKECHIWKYSGDKWANHELVGYFEEDKGIVMVVMTSRNKSDFENAQQAFLELTKSYFFVTSKVDYPKN